MGKKLVFLGTGGTIAGNADNVNDNVGYRAAQWGIASLLQAIPQLEHALGSHSTEWEQVVQCDSKDMDATLWWTLARRVQWHLNDPAVTGIVITHGTDTLEETAFFLSRILPAALLAGKPVVLTCAMRPASAHSPDGPQNILDAIAVAKNAAARGVVAVCAGKIHAAQYVQKVHPYRLDAFDSGDAGVLGFVEESAVRWVHPCDWCVLPETPDLSHLLEYDATACPRVEIVMSHAGATGAVVEALCTDSSLAGIVVAATGNGTVHVHLEKALHQAQRQGVRVVRASRCAYGALVGVVQEGQGITAGLSPVKTRIALMLELMAKRMNARNTAPPLESSQSAAYVHSEKAHIAQPNR